MPAEQTGRREEKRPEWPSETQERALEGRAYVFFPRDDFRGFLGLLVKPHYRQETGGTFLFSPQLCKFFSFLRGR